MTDHLPEPQPGDMLVPPPRVPPTAVASASSQPSHRQVSFSRHIVGSGPRGGLGVFVAAALDKLDALGDRIAAAAGLR